MMVQLNNFFVASGSRNFIAKWAGLGLSKTWKAWTQTQLAFWEDKSLAKRVWPCPPKQRGDRKLFGPLVLYPTVVASKVVWRYDSMTIRCYSDMTWQSSPKIQISKIHMIHRELRNVLLTLDFGHPSLLLHGAEIAQHRLRILKIHQCRMQSTSPSHSMPMQWSPCVFWWVASVESAKTLVRIEPPQRIWTSLTYSRPPPTKELCRWVGHWLRDVWAVVP